MSVILILGGQYDCHAQHLLNRCRERHLDAELFDSAEYPHNASISWLPQQGEGCLQVAGRRVPFSDIHSAFWSSLETNYALRAEHAACGMVALNDSVSMLRTLLENEQIAWLNNWQVYQYHKVKPRQLMHAANLGVRIPDTFTGNDPEQASAFLKRHAKSIFKPVYGGALCSMVEVEQTQEAYLHQALKISPVTLQAFIAGTNVRTYVIGNQCYSATIDSANVDFREDSQARHALHALPESIARQAVDVTRAFGMGWSAIDWRLDEHGHYYFLEANPSPMFMFFEAQTGYPITDALVDSLCAGMCHHKKGSLRLPFDTQWHKSEGGA